MPEVPVPESVALFLYREIKVRKQPGGRLIVDDEDSTFRELRAAVAAAGLGLRTWLPGTRGTMDARSDRVNVHLKSDGPVWRIMGINMG